MTVETTLQEMFDLYVNEDVSVFENALNGIVKK